MEIIRARVDSDYSFVSKAWHSYKGREDLREGGGYPGLLTPLSSFLAVVLSAWLISKGIGVPPSSVPILKLTLFALILCCLVALCISLINGSKPVTSWAEEKLFGSDLAYFTATFFDHEIAISTSSRDIEINYADILDRFETKTGLCFETSDQFFFIPKSSFPRGMLPLAKSRLNIEKKISSRSQTSILSPILAFLIPFISIFILAADRLEVPSSELSYGTKVENSKKQNLPQGCNIDLDAIRQAKSQSILFIGNSITAAEGTPNKVCEILNSYRGGYFCYSATASGVSLENHYQASKGENLHPSLDCLAKTLREAKDLTWDLIILQEQSMVAGLDPQGQYYRKLLKGIKGLHSEFETENYLYLLQTWGFVDGDKKIHTRRYTNFETMHNHLRNGFYAAKEKLGKDGIGISLIPVGDGFAELREKDRRMFRALYASDRHPSALGSNLTALMIAKKINPRAETRRFKEKYLSSRENQLFTNIIEEIYEKE